MNEFQIDYCNLIAKEIAKQCDTKTINQNTLNRQTSTNLCKNYTQKDFSIL